MHLTQLLLIPIVVKLFQSIPVRNLVMKRNPSTAKVTISRDRILRAVASSSAIETGESTEVIEKRLKTKDQRFAKLALAS